MKYLKLFESFEDTEDKMAWQEFFEILSFRYYVGGDQFRLIEPGHPEFNDCIQDCVESEWRKDEIEINSVRRKEDGEIFTLGKPVFNVSLDIKLFGNIDKLWPSFYQMRADIGNGGFPLNHNFFKSETSLTPELVKKYGGIRESKSNYEITQDQWYDLIKRFQTLTPTKTEFDLIKSIVEERNIGTMQEDEPNLAGTKSITILSRTKNIVIWKLEDDWWSIYVSRPGNGELYLKCDQLEEVLDLLKNL
jgi:hypothetical protein